MASPTLKELKYRKFDELMDEIYIDLPSFAREGMIEPGQLIKVAQRVNYEIGLKIHTTKETILEIEHGRAKLPDDFYILNLALLCHGYTVVEDGLFNGIQSENRVIVNNPNTIPQLTSCPCWTVVAQAVQATVTYCDGTVDSVFFPANTDGSPKTTKLCATSIVKTGGGSFSATTNSNCWNDPATGTLSCIKPETCGCTTVEPACGAINTDPWNQNRVFTQCDNTQVVNVIEYHSNEVRRYQNFERIQMVPSKEATAYCVNTQFRDTYHQGHIKNGHIYVPTLRWNGEGYPHQDTTAKIYICYLGQMEDEDGNLMVLDHPKINEFYEWAIKARIFENMYLNGEPDIERRLQLVEAKLKTARAEALSIATMPDFYELKKTIEQNRKAMYHKYVHPFSQLFANTPGWPWSINNEYI
jgi:hypothetical protein